MSTNIIKIYKKAGETPLDCINKLKKDNKELANTPMTYAGRLDPLASGVLLILVGDEVHKKNEYLNLPKEYEIEILFGFSTDTYDILGKITSIQKDKDINISEKANKSFGSFIGKIKQKYPPYSSRPVQGKPLFEWARLGKLNEIEIPSHNVLINNIKFIGQRKINGRKLLEIIKTEISKISGDFRQEEILSLWEEALRDKDKEEYSVIKLVVNCGSGVYMRSLANDIGEYLGARSLALKIVRTKVGDYSI